LAPIAPVVADESIRDPMMEATEFLKKVAAPKNAEDAAVNKKSTVNTAKKPNYGGEPVDFDKGGAEKGPGKVSAKDANAPNNVGLKQEKKKAPEAKTPGDDKGNNKSPFTKTPRPM
jgi:hypothetical protein